MAACKLPHMTSACSVLLPAIISALLNHSPKFQLEHNLHLQATVPVLKALEIKMMLKDNSVDIAKPAESQP